MVQSKRVRCVPEFFGEPVEQIIRDFVKAGLGSIPGGGGEILVDRVRQRIAPLKAMSDEWLGVMDAAHRLGLASTATMMFGHVETVEERIEHLERVRAQQDKSKGFTAFIAWTFQAEHTKLKAPTVGAHEYLRMQALSRIYLDNIPNIQSSWVTQGQEIGQIALKYGANDLGSIMIEENVVSQAGTTFCMEWRTCGGSSLTLATRRATGQLVSVGELSAPSADFFAQKSFDARWRKWSRHPRRKSKRF